MENTTFKQTIRAFLLDIPSPLLRTLVSGALDPTVMNKYGPILTFTVPRA
jgi:hypothetical protein